MYTMVRGDGVTIGRDIPWTRIVQFHREVTRRAEEAFFALPARFRDSERWTCLDGYQADSFGGPWTVPSNAVSSDPFLAQLRQGDLETVFLGALAWPAWRRGDRNKWVLDLRPVLYREVRLGANDQGSLQLVPAQGKWEFSPLAFQLLDRRGVATERPLDDWLPDMLEEASVDPSATDGLAVALRRVLSSHLPELAEELEREWPSDAGAAPSPWMLFSPPSRTSAIFRHLMWDYDRLEKLLARDAENRGGFAVLEGRAVAPEAVDDEVLPIVPLNESQHAAVQGILKGKPITVISGPPGTGKSQVVVSTVLNAWARGMSVLFTSNNNQAVDVVRERVKAFEDEFPIAIRAGSRKASNLEEAIRRTLNVIAQAGASGTVDGVAAEERRSSLAERRDELREMLDSNLPDRISQSWRSALNAHARHKAAVAELDHAEYSVRDQLEDLGFSMEAEDFERAFFIPMCAWLDQLKELHSELVAVGRRRAVLLANVAGLEAQREEVVRTQGMDPDRFIRWDWLAGSAPEHFRRWLDGLEELLAGIPGEHLAQGDWESDYEEWSDSAAASSWADDAVRLAQQIVASSDRFREDEVRLSQAESAQERARAGLEALGLPVLRPAKADLSAWATVYAEDCGLPRTRFSWLPWSEKSRVRRKLQTAERPLRTYFPPSAWKGIGRLDDDGRGRLAELVEVATRWSDAVDAWEGLQEVRAKWASEFGELRQLARQLGRDDVPSEIDSTLWTSFAEALRAHAEVAGRAASAWAHRERQVEATTKLQDVASEYLQLGGGMPLKEAWTERKGVTFERRIRQLLRSTTRTTFEALRAAVYSEPVRDFSEAWVKAAALQEEIESIQREVEELPTEAQLAATWWTQVPAHLPDDGYDRSLLAREGHLLVDFAAKCERWMLEWRKFIDETRPTLEASVKQESDWAQEQLKAALTELPDGPERREVEALVSEATTGEDLEWPIHRLEEAFTQFNPERIRARIAAIDHDLQALSFDLAKGRWVEKLAADVQVQSDLDALLKRYKANKGAIRSEDYAVFERVLPALPIWVTTALSPQALPLVAGLFDVVIIDEATQCTVTNLLPLVFRAKRLVVIGDPEQLPAIPVLTPGAEQALAVTYEVDEWLDLLGHAQQNVYSTAVQSLPRMFSDVIALVEHYRSHPLIIGFSNQHVYQRQLRLRKQAGEQEGSRIAGGIHGLDVKGVAERGERGRSWMNRPEAEAVVDTIGRIRSDESLGHLSIGVVSPFRAQVYLVQELAEEAGLTANLVVGTAHRFQGDERDVVLFSPVVAKGMSSSAAKWVETPQNLINVAVTRAREALFFVADYTSCRSQSGILGSLTRYVGDVTRLRETSLEELDLFSHMVVQGWNPEVHPVIRDLEVDFVLRSPGVRIVVEVDGDQHQRRTAEDQARDSFLRAQGYEVYRTPARAVRETPATVIQEIGQLMAV